jgi:hypothetical protein
VAFGAGLPIFSGESGTPEAVFARLGYRLAEEEKLNARGTRLLTLVPE